MKLWLRPNQRTLLIILAVMSAIRLAALIASPLNLHGDEAQYYDWSRHLDWGYFSKPPMVAWLIAATTSLFGHSEWAVRLSSVILHPLIAFVIFRTGRFLWSETVGFWASLAYFLMPAVFLSSTIVSTDVPLLLCWAVALNALLHMRTTGAIKWAVVLGVAVGFGFLSKYAMVFFVIALGLATIFDRQTRKAILSRLGLIASALALLIMAPNLIWNAQNDFATLSHTAANANLQGFQVHPLEFLEFFASQFVLFGPISMGFLLFGLGTILRRRKDSTLLLLSLFVLTPLLIISVEAFISRANANWAVSAYIAGALVCAWAGMKQAPNLFKSGIALNLAAGFIFILAVTFPPIIDAAGMANAVKRVRGWPETTAKVSALANAGYDGTDYSVIAADMRLVFYDLSYYGITEHTGLPIKMWLKFNHVNNHAEASAALPASDLSDPPVLLISQYKDFQKFFEADFARLVPLQPISIVLGGGKTRILYPYAGYGYTPTQASQR